MLALPARSAAQQHPIPLSWAAATGMRSYKSQPLPPQPKLCARAAAERRACPRAASGTLTRCSSRSCTPPGTRMTPSSSRVRPPPPPAACACAKPLQALHHCRTGLADATHPCKPWQQATQRGMHQSSHRLPGRAGQTRQARRWTTACPGPTWRRSSARMSMAALAPPGASRAAEGGQAVAAGRRAARLAAPTPGGPHCCATC